MKLNFRTRNLLFSIFIVLQGFTSFAQVNHLDSPYGQISKNIAFNSAEQKLLNYPSAYTKVTTENPYRMVHCSDLSSGQGWDDFVALVMSNIQKVHGFESSSFLKNFAGSHFGVEPKASKDYLPFYRALKSLNDCLPSIDSEVILERAEKLRRFLISVGISQLPDHSYGYLVSDKEYVATAPEEALELPEEAMLNLGLVQNYEEVFRSNGWPFFRYRSRHVANGKNLPFSFERLLLMIPGDTRTQLIQYTFPPKGQETTSGRSGFLKGDIINLISIDHSEDGANRIYFREFQRDSQGRVQNRVHKASNCYSCHSNGVRMILPVAGSIPIEQESSHKQIDRFLKQAYNSRSGFDFGNYLPIEDFGPQLAGQMNVEESQRLGLRRPISCQQCHDESKPLNFVANSRHLKFKMVDELTMPIGMSVESKALRNGLPLNIYKKMSESIGADSEIASQIYGGFQCNPVCSYTRVGSLQSLVSQLEDLRIIESDEAREAQVNIDRLQESASQYYERIMRQYLDQEMNSNFSTGKYRCTLHFTLRPSK